LLVAGGWWLVRVRVRVLVLVLVVGRGS